jgi:hypothetical protein
MRWFRGAEDRHEAHIHAGGLDKDVQLVETDDVNDEIDAAYRTKYHRYAPRIIDSIVSPASPRCDAQARAALVGDGHLDPHLANRPLPSFPMGSGFAWP